jgi:hypothetical protein
MIDPVVRLARKHNLEMARKRSLFHTDDLGYKPVRQLAHVG